MGPAFDAAGCYPCCLIGKTKQYQSTARHDFNTMSTAISDAFLCMFIEVEGEVVSETSQCRYQTELMRQIE